MPLRNLLLIAFASLLSLVSYQKANHDRYSSRLTEAMNIVQHGFVKPVKRNELFDQAMKGMIDGLNDPYSEYMPRDDYAKFMQSIKQEFVGVGIQMQLDPETKRPMVMRPIYGSPAQRAGIKSGDIIMKIDGNDTENIELPKASEFIRGKANTDVTFEVLHLQEKEPVKITMTRATVETETVLGDVRLDGGKWDFRLGEDRRILYLRVTSVGDKTHHEIVEALEQTKDAGGDYQAVILDLRSNPGGMLDGAVKICDMFLDEGRIVSTRKRDVKRGDVKSATRGTLIPSDMPMVVLVNHNSASASEIIAACLQDHARAKIIGERTWGKGSVQNVISIDNGKNGGMRLTTASYWRPNGHNIHREKDDDESKEWGVSPSPGFEVKLTEEELKKVITARMAKDQDGPAEKPKVGPDGKPLKEETFDDPQLRKGIDYLKKQLEKKAKATM